MPSDMQSIQRQLAEAEENLRHIRERKAQYALAEDVPLQITKNERATEEKIVRLRGTLEGMSTVSTDNVRTKELEIERLKGMLEGKFIASSSGGGNPVQSNKSRLFTFPAGLALGLLIGLIAAFVMWEFFPDTLPTLRPTLNAEDYYTLGSEHFNDKAYDQAIDFLSAAIRLDPEDTDAYNLRGLAYSNVDKDNEAIADYTRAIEIDPAYAAAYNNRGLVYKAQGNYNQAVADFTRAIELDPKTLGYYNRGLIYKEQGRTAEAIADFDQFLEQSEDAYWIERAERHLRDLRGE